MTVLKPKLYNKPQACAFVAELLGLDAPIPRQTWDSYLIRGLVKPDFVKGKQNAGKYLEKSLRAFADELAVNRDPSGYQRRAAKRLRRPD